MYMLRPFYVCCFPFGSRLQVIYIHPHTCYSLHSRFENSVLLVGVPAFGPTVDAVAHVHHALLEVPFARTWLQLTS